MLNCKVPLPNGYSDKPIPEYYLDLLRNFLGIQNGSFSLHMPLEEQDRLWADDFLRQHQVKPDDTVLGVIPGGGASWGKDFAHRHWAPEQYNKLCKMITEKLKLKVILLGSQQDLSICNQVKEGLEERMYVMSCGRTTIGQFAALIKRCALVICNDGGPLHVAVAQGVKTVSIFGPVNEKVYGPYPPNPRHIVVKKDLACRPCYKRFKMADCQDRKCLKLISVEEVIEKVENLL